MPSIDLSAFLLNTLSVYRDILHDPVVSSMHSCLNELNQGTPDSKKIVDAYCRMCASLYESEYRGNIYDYVLDLVLSSMNPFTRACADNGYFKISVQIKNAAKHDLNVLYAITHFSSEDMKTAFKTKGIEKPDFIDLLPDYSSTPFKFNLKGRWGDNMAALAEAYSQNGIGMFYKYKAFTFQRNRTILPVRHPDPIRLADLKRYEPMRQKVIENTLAFLNGEPYQNVLLYGDRGTGKSSTVKALLNEFSDKRLRLIELSRQNLLLIDQLLLLIEDIPMKFILFIDDLSFGEDDQNYSVLKALLEGSVASRPDNVAVYATSNRRHLIKETFQSRLGDEVHRADTIDESLSLSDRFGLTVTFMKPNKDEYLDIVLQLAKDRNISADESILTEGAERFALAKSGRTPRVAKQYIETIQARLNLKLDIQ